MVHHRPRVAPVVGHEPKHAVDCGARRRRGGGRGGGGKKVWAAVVGVVDEDTVDMVWEKVREQQLVAVDDVAPRLADAPRRGEACRW